MLTTDVPRVDFVTVSGSCAIIVALKRVPTVPPSEIRYSVSASTSYTSEKQSVPPGLHAYDLTTHAGGNTNTAEVWANLNLFPSTVIDDVDDDVSLFLGAALWILDNCPLFELESLLQDVDYEDDWTLPYFYDLKHTDPVIQAVVYILQYRYKYLNNFLDLDDRPGDAGEAFAKLMELIDPAKLRHAVETTKSIFQKETDGFFDVAYVLAERFRNGVETHNKAVDVYNDEVDRATPMIKDFLDVRKGKRTSPKLAAGSPLMKPGSPLLMPSGSPQIQNISSLMDSFMMPSTSPLGFMNRDTQDPSRKFHDTVEHLATLGERADTLREKADGLYGDILRFVFSYSHCGFSLSSDYSFHFEGITMPSIDIPDPFEACMGLLILCSPPLYHEIYSNGAGDEDLDLPWLTGLAAATARDIASFLPWGLSAYEEDMVDLREPPKPLKHPEWYERRYLGEDSYERSLSQILYETTGAIIPRDMSGFDNAHHILWHYGIRGKNEAHMAELMVLLNTPQYRTSLMLAHGSEADEEEDSTTSVDIDSLQAQLKKLREQNKKLTDEAHEQERRARKAEQALSAEREKAKADRQELAGLREVVFAQENTSSEERVSITFPYEVKSHIVIYGGHDTWLTPMKEFLTGDIRFMDREQSVLDENVMRNADVVWIQPNALSHSKYYKIIGQIRKHDIPVKYFLYASARKCAEQVALSETT